VWVVGQRVEQIVRVDVCAEENARREGVGLLTKVRGRAASGGPGVVGWLPVRPWRKGLL
jgi:hypothetical protein